MKANQVHKTPLYRSVRGRLPKHMWRGFLESLKDIAENQHNLFILWDSRELSAAFIWDESDQGNDFWKEYAFEAGEIVLRDD